MSGTTQPPHLSAVKSAATLNGAPPAFGSLASAGRPALGVLPGMTPKALSQARITVARTVARMPAIQARTPLTRGWRLGGDVEVAPLPLPSDLERGGMLLGPPQRRIGTNLTLHGAAYPLKRFL